MLIPKGTIRLSTEPEAPEAGKVRFLTLGLALSLMGLNMARVGVDPGLPRLVIFIGMALANLVLTALLLAAVKPAGGAA